MGLIDLRLRHLFHHFLLGNGGIGVPSDGGKDVPHISAHQVWCRHAATDFVIPPNTGLRAGVALHRGSQIPIKSTNIVALDAKARRVHDADQFFGFGISGPRCRQELGHRGDKVARIHRVARGLDLGQGRPAKAKKDNKGNWFHLWPLFVVLGCAPAYGTDLPRPLQPSDFQSFDARQVKLGQLLFFDPILSGNRNISCGTCHSPDHASADGLSLGIGEGGMGVGPDRTPGTGAERIAKRIPRNAPALWNLGAKEIDTLFHDGRVTVSDIYENGFNSPAQEWLPQGLNSILAVQALFPLTSQFEMAGDPKENQVAGAAYDRIDAVWPILAKRVRIIPEYATQFVAAFDDVVDPLDVDISHIANALAAFQATEYQSIDSPFDAYLAGERSALSTGQLAGLELFFGKVGCSGCHSGPLLTDQKFHALMLPHFGPGRTRKWDPVVRDPGHMAVSDRLEDAYRFRTPSLRNVALTGPYGHNGAYPTLGGIIRHHLDPTAGFAEWCPGLAALPDVPWLSEKDFLPFADAYERSRLASRLDIRPVPLSEAEVDDLVAFLHALTGTSSIKGRLGRPASVPSGLRVD